MIRTVAANRAGQNMHSQGLGKHNPKGLPCTEFSTSAQYPHVQKDSHVEPLGQKRIRSQKAAMSNIRRSEGRAGGLEIEGEEDQHNCGNKQTSVCVCIYFLLPFNLPPSRFCCLRGSTHLTPGCTPCTFVKYRKLYQHSRTAWALVN